MESGDDPLELIVKHFWKPVACWTNYRSLGLLSRGEETHSYKI
jgi:hypothetical protein